LTPGDAGETWLQRPGKTVCSSTMNYPSRLPECIGAAEIPLPPVDKDRQSTFPAASLKLAFIIVMSGIMVATNGIVSIKPERIPEPQIIDIEAWGILFSRKELVSFGTGICPSPFFPLRRP